MLQVLAQCYGNTEEYVINLSILLQWGLGKILMGGSFRETMTFKLRVKEKKIIPTERSTGKDLVSSRKSLYRSSTVFAF